jgi:DNA polymerase V
MRVLANFTPNLEIYSIDDAFLSLAGFETQCEAHARELRRTVQQWRPRPNIRVTRGQLTSQNRPQILR